MCLAWSALLPDTSDTKKAVSSRNASVVVRTRSILFDEVEKAHPDVFNMLLQVMDDGRLDRLVRSAQSTSRNAIIIMTSNIGSDIIKGGANFGFTKREEVQDYEKIKKALFSEAEKFFRPEFINRLDDMIVFRPLIKADLTSHH